MNPFDPASLSPKQKEALACELPYGLTWEDLKPLLSGFFPQARIKAQAFASHDKQGLNGGDNSCILTIHYRIEDGDQRTETIFVKHNEDPNKAEALKYLFLASQGIPVPRLLASFKNGEAETIILEFLPKIGIDFSSASEVNSLLDLVAKINSVQNTPSFIKPQPGLPQGEFDELVRTALEKLEHELIRPDDKNKIDAAHWYDAYQKTQKVVQSMPVALNHNEFFFQQVGWAQRGSARQIVVFDLETMALFPRFADIASILYPLSVYTGQDQLYLFQTYLEKLSRLIHIDQSIDEALREFRYLRFNDSCESLPWLVNEATNPDAVDMHESLSMTLSALWDDFTSLGL